MTYNQIMDEAMLHIQIERELSAGLQAREQGLEGKARVCARRAVGIVLRHHFSRRQPQMASLSVVDMIQIYHESSDLPPSIREICAHLLTRVDPDYNLPVPVDLLAEAQLLIDHILEELNRNDRSA